MRRLLLAAAALAAAAHPAPLPAQYTDPSADWRSLHTEHFSIHFPEELRQWSLPLASRMEAVRDAVEALVGYAPAGRVDVVVTDPFGVPNGTAVPYLDHPLITVFPTPPTPRTEIGEHRGWGELLAVHEYAHAAHLARPSRSPRERLRTLLLGVPIGPVFRNSPRWLMEGYATYVEGRVTGGGRPFGVWRPALLRQWALEGKLPSYAELSGAEGYRAGAMAYLAGSAFLEWLAEREGEQSLRDLSRRLTARERRGFSEAFSGVFRGTPDDLYDRFTVEITGAAVAARERLEAAGLQAGEEFQALAWETGDPALSPDGRHVAVERRDGGGDSRVVVWSTEEQPEDSAAVRRRERLLERDPEDVPAVQWRPRPRDPVAILRPATGFAYRHPRFLPDGRSLLVVRGEPVPGGSVVADLFLWEYATGRTRRITTGAGIHSADPTPDGVGAIGVRCGLGRCDLVRVDLRDGDVTRLAPASNERVFYRPRVAPDGRTAAVAVQERGRWRVALVELATGALRYVDPDDGADRYDASFTDGGRALVVASHAGGVPNLELLDPGTATAVPLTRVTGAAVAPEPARDGGPIYFLSLHAEGMDLRRLPAEAGPLDRRIALDPAFWPAAPAAAFAAPALPEADALPEARPYGAGPRRWRWQPGATSGPAGDATLLAFASSDPVGRLTLLLQAATANEAEWSGASASAAWRGWGPTVLVEGFHTEQAVSAQPSDPLLRLPADLRYSGALAGLELSRSLRTRAQALRLGTSAGVLEASPADGPRFLAFADYAGRLRLDLGTLTLSPSLALHGSFGATDGSRWRRGLASAALDAAAGRVGVHLEALHGRVRPDRARSEEFTVGGSDPSLVDPALLSQRIPVYALPIGVLAGNRVTTLRAHVSLLGVQPYLWAGSTSPDLSDWYRLAGVEAVTRTGPLPSQRLGSLDLVTGVGYPLDAPRKREVQLYARLAYRP